MKLLVIKLIRTDTTLDLSQEAEKNGRRNPITAFAELGGTSLLFPNHHLMNQFKNNNQYMAKLGRLALWRGLVSLRERQQPESD